MRSTDLRSEVRTYKLRYLHLTDAHHLSIILIGNRELQVQELSSSIHSGVLHYHKAQERSYFDQDRMDKKFEMWSLHHGL